MVNARDVLSKATSLLKRGGIDNPRIEAELLLEDTLGLQRAHFYLDKHLSLPLAKRKVFWQRVKARLRGVPIQYILGHQAFRCLNLKVNPRVFIPRPETELLVEYAISAIREKFKDLDCITFIDIGTGTGAIALSLVSELPNVSGWAVDICEAALSVAKENAQACRLEDRITFVESNLFDNLSEDLYSQIDLIVSNPPYICSKEITTLQSEVRDFESHQALDGGRDGLDWHREIITSAPLFLKKGGILALEIGKDQTREVTNLLKETGEFSHIKVFKDYAAIDRVIIATCE